MLRMQGNHRPKSRDSVLKIHDAYKDIVVPEVISFNHGAFAPWTQTHFTVPLIFSAHISNV